MVTTLQVRWVGLLLLVGALGYAAVRAAPEGTHTAGMWPVGLASGLLVQAGTRDLRRAGGLVLTVAFASLVLGGLPVAVAAAYAAGIVLEAVVVQHVLSVRWKLRRREHGPGLGVFLLAAVSGAATGAVAFGHTAAAAGYGEPRHVAASVFITHLASQLTLLAFFMKGFRHAGVGGHRERAARWVLAVSVTLVAFVPLHLPVAVFVLLPLLGWVALRAPMREALWLLVVVGIVADTLTALGRGPFVLLARVLDRPPDLSQVPQQAFLISCALVCIPFALAASEQRRSGRETAHERERLRRIVEGARGTAIIETDRRGLITLFNPGAEDMLGYAEDEVLGHAPGIFHTSAEIARHAADLGVEPDLRHVGLALIEPGARPREWLFVRKDGDVRTLAVSLSQITDHEGAVVGYLITAEDVTERTRTHDALTTALQTERQAVARLTEVDRTKDAFVSSVSHELRTPITNIVGYLELLQDGTFGETTSPQQDALDRIDTNSHRLLELIDDLLTLSCIEALDLQLALEPVDLREVVRRSAERVHPEVAQRSQQVEVLLPDHPVVIRGDGSHLERMVGNLAVNAVKFTPEGGRVVLRLREDPAGCAIEVQDSGVGIPAEEQPQLFTRFFRSSFSQSAAVQGTGLGLSIARSIAHRHGARISATSTPGRGSLFTVTFADPERQPVPSPRTPS